MTTTNTINTNAINTPATGVTASALLAELNISVWTARKLDRKVSAEVDQSKSTRARAGNYHKRLLAGTSALEDIQKIAGEARTLHYTHTLPWSDGGARLLPAATFYQYKQRLAEIEQRFNDAVEDFLNQYPALVSAAAFTLGALFSRDEYPDVDDIRGKFRFKYAFSPVPESGDFRVDIEAEAKRELQEQYRDYYQTRMDEAMHDAWQRLHDTLTHMSEKLDDGSDKKKRIHESTVTNARELCELLTSLNVTRDPALERARSRLEQALLGVHVDELRADPLVRADTKRKVDEIMDMLG